MGTGFQGNYGLQLNPGQRGICMDRSWEFVVLIVMLAGIVAVAAVVLFAPATLVISDASGRVFHNTTIRHNETISLNNLATGIYFAKISRGKEAAAQKIVIVH
jgi:hypothetical protein